MSAATKQALGAARQALTALVARALCDHGNQLAGCPTCRPELALLSARIETAAVTHYRSEIARPR